MLLFLVIVILPAEGGLVVGAVITDDHVHSRIRVEVGLDIELEVVGQKLLPLMLAADEKDVAGHRKLRVEHGLHAGS